MWNYYSKGSKYEGYNVGLNNYIELQDALTNYNNSQRNFIEAVFNYNVSCETLLKSMGVR